MGLEEFPSAMVFAILTLLSRCHWWRCLVTRGGVLESCLESVWNLFGICLGLVCASPFCPGFNTQLALLLCYLNCCCLFCCDPFWCNWSLWHHCFSCLWWYLLMTLLYHPQYYLLQHCSPWLLQIHSRQLLSCMKGATKPGWCYHPRLNLQEGALVIILVFRPIHIK